MIVDAQPQNHILHTATNGVFLYSCGESSVIGREGNNTLPKPISNFQQKEQPSKLHPSTPHLNPAGYPIISISLGSAHSVIVSKSGKVYTWGMGTSGRLGHNSSKKIKYPTVVETLAKSKVVGKEASCGYFHTIVKDNKGLLYSVGRGYKGFLGHNNQNNCSTFKVIQCLQNIKIKQVCAAIALS